MLPVPLRLAREEDDLRGIAPARAAFREGNDDAHGLSAPLLDRRQVDAGERVRRVAGLEPELPLVGGVTVSGTGAAGVV